MALPFDATRLFPSLDRRSSKEIEGDIIEELQAHLALSTQAKIDAGVEPDEARRRAEQSFGDLAEVFGACRTEKLRSRIMLQRTLLALVVLLLVAVTVQAYHIRGERTKNGRALAAMQNDLAAMATRLEDREAEAQQRDAEQARVGTQGRLWLLRQSQAQYTPDHSRWLSLQVEIEELEAELSRLEALAAGVPQGDRARNAGGQEPAPGSPEWFRSQEGKYQGRVLVARLLSGDPEAFAFAVGVGGSTVTELAAVLRHPDAPEAVRLAAVRTVAEICTSPAWVREPVLVAGDIVSIFDSFHEELNGNFWIDPQGNIRLPHEGFVPVAGMTRSEVMAHLQEVMDPLYLQLDLSVSKHPPARIALESALEFTAREDPSETVRDEASRVLETLR